MNHYFLLLIITLAYGENVNNNQQALTKKKCADNAAYGDENDEATNKAFDAYENLKNQSCLVDIWTELIDPDKVRADVIKKWCNPTTSPPTFSDLITNAKDCLEDNEKGLLKDNICNFWKKYMCSTDNGNKLLDFVDHNGIKWFQRQKYEIQNCTQRNGEVPRSVQNIGLLWFIDWECDELEPIRQCIYNTSIEDAKEAANIINNFFKDYKLNKSCSESTTTTKPQSTEPQTTNSQTQNEKHNENTATGLYTYLPRFCITLLFLFITCLIR